jgi:hypothetical protein
MIAQNIFNRFDASMDIYQKKKATPQLHKAYLIFRVVLLIANLAFLIFGCVLIGVGSYALNGNVASLSGQTLPAGLIVMVTNRAVLRRQHASSRSSSTHRIAHCACRVCSRFFCLSWAR